MMDVLENGDPNAETVFLLAHGAGAPMDTPFIPPWNRVISAVPKVMEELRGAVEEDMAEFGS